MSIIHGGGRAGLYEWGWVVAGYDLDEVEFTEFVEDMMNGDITLRTSSVEALWKLPTGDERFLPYLEQLLYDKTPCLLGIPYIYGEIRWLAAHALVAEREVQGISTPVRLQNVVRPIYTAGISQAEEAAGIEFKWGVEGVLENLGILRDMGYLPMYDLNLSPSPNSSLVSMASPPTHLRRDSEWFVIPRNEESMATNRKKKRDSSFLGMTS